MSSKTHIKDMLDYPGDLMFRRVVLENGPEHVYVIVGVDPHAGEHPRLSLVREEHIENALKGGKSGAPPRLDLYLSGVSQSAIWGGVDGKVNGKSVPREDYVYFNFLSDAPYGSYADKAEIEAGKLIGWKQRYTVADPAAASKPGVSGVNDVIPVLYRAALNGGKLQYYIMVERKDWSRCGYMPASLAKHWGLNAPRPEHPGSPPRRMRFDDAHP